MTSDPVPDRFAILTHGLWTSRFGADPALVGRSIRWCGDYSRAMQIPLVAGRVFADTDTAHNPPVVRSRVSSLRSRVSRRKLLSGRRPAQCGATAIARRRPLFIYLRTSGFWLLTSASVRPVAYHIVNARIVNEGTVTSGDLSVARGRILGVNVPAPPGAEVIDAAGACLLPGMIDDQVALPRAGVRAQGDDRNRVARRRRRRHHELPGDAELRPADGDGGRARGQARQGRRPGRWRTTGSISARPTTTWKRSRRSTGDWRAASRSSWGPAPATCLSTTSAHSTVSSRRHRSSSPPTASTRRRSPRMKRPPGPDTGTISRSRSTRASARPRACYRSSSLAVELATRHDARLHVLHITTARELDLFESGDVADKRITAGSLRTPPVLQRHRVSRPRRRHQMQPGHQVGRRPAGALGGGQRRPHRRHRDRPRAAYRGGEGPRVR